MISTSPYSSAFLLATSLHCATQLQRIKSLFLLACSAMILPAIVLKASAVKELKRFLWCHGRVLVFQQADSLVPRLVQSEQARCQREAPQGIASATPFSLISVVSFHPFSEPHRSAGHPRIQFKRPTVDCGPSHAKIASAIRLSASLSHFRQVFPTERYVMACTLLFLCNT